MINVKVDFDPDPVKVLDGLKSAVQRRILKKAVRKAARPMRNAVKDAVPRETGALRASISSKISENKRRGRVSAIVGPRVNYEKAKKGVIKKPVKYAGIVEKRKPFLRPAWNARKRTYMEVVRAEIATEVEKELKKQAK